MEVEYLAKEESKKFLITVPTKILPDIEKFAAEENRSINNYFVSLAIREIEKKKINEQKAT